ncbi:hypothetical protein GOODEAATRI_005629 [Goodea atripinnis]|uniref:Uncharacterized protein n=1 Tax=Goodea atripinnis TaxID=208336 RepID=A0ABV0PL40_9TELE
MLELHTLAEKSLYYSIQLILVHPFHIITFRAKVLINMKRMSAHFDSSVYPAVPQQQQGVLCIIKPLGNSITQASQSHLKVFPFEDFTRIIHTWFNTVPAVGFSSIST